MARNRRERRRRPSIEYGSNGDTGCGAAVGPIAVFQVREFATLKRTFPCCATLSPPVAETVAGNGGGYTLQGVAVFALGS
jgi:hypothetical protein